MIEGLIRITDNNLTVIKELAVLWDHRTPWLCQFAIKLHEHHYLIISRNKFNNIIRKAEEAGLLVFDYTDFY